MKILQLTAENIKKLKVVQIKPDGNLVQITGPNGAGKSSVLDSIYYALAGTTELPNAPVRKGAGKGHVRLDLGDMVVIRRFVEGGGTSLVVEAKNGARFPSPQKMLDELLGKLSFDPLAFTRMDARRQLENLRGLVTLETDIDALDAANRADFERRTEVNRQAKTLAAQIGANPVPANLPEKAIDISMLIHKLESAANHNAGIERERNERSNYGTAISNNRSAAQKKRAEAARLTREAEELERTAQADADALEKRPALPDAIDTKQVTVEIEGARWTNAAIELRDRVRQWQSDLNDAHKESEELTKAMQERTDQRTAAITQAKMPLEGLGFGEGYVTYSGLPLDQASDAEQLRISIAIAMAANPKLRVLRIKDGSLLDENSLHLIAEMADKSDYQVWIERVDTSGKVGIVMEDGAVAPPPKPAEAAAQGETTTEVHKPPKPKKEKAAK